MVLGDSVTGEAREVAKVYAALARQIRAACAPREAAGGPDFRRRMHGHRARQRPRRALREFLLSLAR